MCKRIVVINAGSATLKVSLFQGEQKVLGILIDRLESNAEPHARIRDARGKPHFEGPIPARNRDQALAWLFQWIEQAGGDFRPDAIGHRIVHGGDTLTEPMRVTTEVMRQIEALIPLAPLHQPHNLAPIRFLVQRFPDLPQVACFDTSFHASQPRLERLFPLPRDYEQIGIRRYGFHGLSYESIASRLPGIDATAAAGRTVVCHLGNGASLCALRKGRSVATTMSFTTLDGIPMATRCGAIDPGLLLYLLDQGMNVATLSDLLYKKSGLLGISGVSGDMRDLLASSKPEAAEAVEYFCYRIAREVGSLTTALGGLDALVFTGGIGEHAAPVRAQVCERLRWLGLEIAAEANANHGTFLHTERSQVRVLVIPTDEEWVIARHTARLLPSQ
ncbi:MAG TPA: acetate/propionate family kinase [Methylococcus sp.]|nr:acetate/propionate family kinase [Methylococcus sp.]